MAVLPGGTVTFLFTDIEGSTKLLQELGDAYGDVVRDHRRLLREHPRREGRHRGRHPGRRLLLLVPARGRRGRCGSRPQRALAAHEWPQGHEVRVRMGLPHGEPSVGERAITG
jgi:class 3 adenylate cyclase